MCIRDRLEEADGKDVAKAFELGVKAAYKAVTVSYTHLDVYKRQKHYSKFYKQHN